MRFNRFLSAFAIWALLSVGLVHAQSIPGDVTFEVPLNLTQVAPDISKALVTCTITSDAIAVRTRKGAAIRPQLGAQVELAVSAGRLVTTARVVVPVTTDRFTDEKTGIYSDPAGKSANYHCELTGFSTKRTTGGGWGPFAAESPDTSFRLSPTPPSLTGSFVW